MDNDEIFKIHAKVDLDNSELIKLIKDTQEAEQNINSYTNSLKSIIKELDDSVDNLSKETGIKINGRDSYMEAVKASSVNFNELKEQKAELEKQIATFKNQVYENKVKINGITNPLPKNISKNYSINNMPDFKIPKLYPTDMEKMIKVQVTERGKRVIKTLSEALRTLEHDSGTFITGEKREEISRALVSESEMRKKVDSKPHGSARDNSLPNLTRKSFGTFATSDGTIVPSSRTDANGNRVPNQTIGVRASNRELSVPKSLRGMIGDSLGRKTPVSDLNGQSVFMLDKVYESLIKKGTDEAKTFAEKIVKTVATAMQNTKESDIAESIRNKTYEETFGEKPLDGSISYANNRPLFSAIRKVYSNSGSNFEYGIEENNSQERKKRYDAETIAKEEKAKKEADVKSNMAASKAKKEIEEFITGAYSPEHGKMASMKEFLSGSLKTGGVEALKKAVEDIIELGDFIDKGDTQEAQKGTVPLTGNGEVYLDASGRVKQSFDYEAEEEKENITSDGSKEIAQKAKTSVKSFVKESILTALNELGAKASSLDERGDFGSVYDYVETSKKFGGKTQDKTISQNTDEAANRIANYLSRATAIEQSAQRYADGSGLSFEEALMQSLNSGEIDNSKAIEDNAKKVDETHSNFITESKKLEQIQKETSNGASYEGAKNSLAEKLKSLQDLQKQLSAIDEEISLLTPQSAEQAKNAHDSNVDKIFSKKIKDYTASIDESFEQAVNKDLAAKQKTNKGYTREDYEKTDFYKRAFALKESRKETGTKGLLQQAELSKNSFIGVTKNLKPEEKEELLALQQLKEKTFAEYNSSHDNQLNSSSGVKSLIKKTTEDLSKVDKMLEDAQNISPKLEEIDSLVKNLSNNLQEQTSVKNTSFNNWQQALQERLEIDTDTDKIEGRKQNYYSSKKARDNFFSTYNGNVGDLGGALEGFFANRGEEIEKIFTQFNSNIPDWRKNFSFLTEAKTYSDKIGEAKTRRDKYGKVVSGYEAAHFEDLKDYDSPYQEVLKQHKIKLAKLNDTYDALEKEYRPIINSLNEQFDNTLSKVSVKGDDTVIEETEFGRFFNLLTNQLGDARVNSLNTGENGTFSHVSPVNYNGETGINRKERHLLYDRGMLVTGSYGGGTLEESIEVARRRLQKENIAEKEIEQINKDISLMQKAVQAQAYIYSTTGLETKMPWAGKVNGNVFKGVSNKGVPSASSMFKNEETVNGLSVPSNVNSMFMGTRFNGAVPANSMFKKTVEGAKLNLENATVVIPEADVKIPEAQVEIPENSTTKKLTDSELTRLASSKEDFSNFDDIFLDTRSEAEKKADEIQWEREKAEAVKKQKVQKQDTSKASSSTKTGSISDAELLSKYYENSSLVSGKNGKVFDAKTAVMNYFKADDEQVKLIQKRIPLLVKEKQLREEISEYTKNLPEGEKESLSILSKKDELLKTQADLKSNLKEYGDAQQTKDLTGVEEARAKNKLGYATGKYDELAKMAELKRTQAIQNGTITGDSVASDSNKAYIKQYLAQYRELLDLQSRISIAQKKASTSTDKERKSYEGLVTALEGTMRIKNSEMLSLSSDEKGKVFLNQRELNANEASYLNKMKAEEENKFANKTALANTQLKEQKGLLTQIGEGFKASFRNLVDYSLAYRVIGQINQAFQNLINTTKELDSNILNLRIVTGDNLKETTEMMKGYNEIATKMGRTTQSVADASNDWLRAGYSGKDAIELTKNSLSLSTLGMIDATSATTDLISALKGWKLEAGEVSSVVDKLVSVDMAAAISAGDLAEAMSRSNNIARTSGSEMNKFIGYVTTMADVTQKSADSIGESMKTVYSRFGNIKAGKFAANSDELTSDDYNDQEYENLNDIETVLDSVGIKLRENATTFRDIDEVLSDIGSKWKTFNDVTQNAIGTAVAGEQRLALEHIEIYGVAV